MKRNNISVLENGVFEEIKREFTFEAHGSGKATSASNTIFLGDHKENEAEFILIKDCNQFIYFVNLGDQSIVINSDVKIEDNELPSFFKDSFLSKSIDDADKIYVLGCINTKEKYPVKTGVLQIVAIEAKDINGNRSLYPMDSVNNIYSVYRDDSFKASEQQKQAIDNLKTTSLTKSEYLELLKSVGVYARKTMDKNTSFDNPSF